MSRYQVDKVFREVVLDPEKCGSFLQDRRAFLEGRDLTEAERRALVEQDYGALYAMGAHPFLLFGWAASTAGKDMPSLLREYCEAVRPHGYPEWAT